MFSLSTLISPLAVLLSFSTAATVFIHDSNVNKVMASAITTTDAVTNPGGVTNKAEHSMNELHIHPDRQTLKQTLLSVGGPLERVQPRGGDDKKYIMTKKHTLVATGANDYVWPSIT